MGPDLTTRTLAAAREPGEEFVIRRIFAAGHLRSYCRDLDIVEGDLVRVEGTGHTFLRIRTARERVVLIERDAARIVEVAPAPRPQARRPVYEARPSARTRRNRAVREPAAAMRAATVRD